MFLQQVFLAYFINMELTICARCGEVIEGEFEVFDHEGETYCRQCYDDILEEEQDLQDEIDDLEDDEKMFGGNDSNTLDDDLVGESDDFDDDIEVLSSLAQEEDLDD